MGKWTCNNCIAIAKYHCLVQLEDVQTTYLPELEKIVKDFFPNVMGYCFWNPMIRGEAYQISRSSDENMHTASIASMVHVDTDVGAFDLDTLLDIVDKNKVHAFTSETAQSFREMAREAILNRHRRFIIINFRRNINDHPVSSAPLAILSTRYEDVLAFPDARPSDESKWYIFDSATRDEVIVFYQIETYCKYQICSIVPFRTMMGGVMGRRDDPLISEH
jgi:hypothetical protein